MTNTPPIDPEAGDSVDPVDPLDERLSAALDGELAPGEEPVRSSAGGRASAIESARDLLAIAPPTLDDVTRRRMLRTAVAALPAANGRESRRLRLLGVAAAAIAIVGGAMWALTSLDHSSSNRAGLAKAASATTVAPVDLHEVSNPLVLKQRVLAALGLAGNATAESGAPASTAVPKPDFASSTAGTAPAISPSRSPATPEPLSRPPGQCLASVHAGAGVTPQILGTATYHGAPSLVVVARAGSRTLVYVLASSDCRLLDYQFLQ